MIWHTARTGEGGKRRIRMSTETLYLVLALLLSTLVMGGGLIILILKYYWGPNGAPPKYRDCNHK